jgi:hypothetical protein
MKIYLLFPLLIWHFNGCKPGSHPAISQISPADTSFSLTICESFDEQSKDSHHYSTTLTLKSEALYYDYIYRGFPDDKTEHKEKSLHDSDITTVKNKIKELSLTMNYNKAYPFNDRGFVVKTGISLKIRTDSAAYSISVTGGRPMDINDEMNNKLYRLYYFLNNYFDK